ncbi:plasmid mobilization relaxosome protein MobC [Vibrio parahaemolyticus]|uniref:Plasmid mobilization relaxosome protein MobC n=2 Tax=Vibrio parahaemolyticus TaxID=670 RepID=A0A7Y0SFS1_VIBPH|nr:plasmid mobilization relaxosome protein MobC [Vibrio parahaemolyticus]NMR86082.1 plasmid mobilization relaxosome protein MobC [Vibrio parahaemolyticus]NMR94062.1 plasmid mobilization relaxosome protein MobC [Vibrio parahaemolyticus]NMR97274.1 plasmid mobilization relaxosome protein MobC [Vibrio parahaemolyticus]NMS03172.1 plasmid mobilization relaxosome protein MobC [Vibrio parahaemolyticus]
MMNHSGKIRRTECIQLRVSKDEKLQIFANANGNVSVWLRTMALNPNSCHHKKLYKEIKQDPALVSEVARIGNNLNQIARYINIEKKSGLLVDLVAVQAQLVQINTLLSALIKLAP